MQAARPRFSLSTLLIAITFLASLMGVWRQVPEFLLGLAVMSAPIVVWLLLLAVTSPATQPTVRTRRQQLRAKRFWRAFWITVPFAALLNLIPYWFTDDLPGTDGARVIGVPLLFYANNFAGLQWFGLQELFIDALALIVFCLLIARVMQSGRRGIAMRIKKFFRGRA